MESKVKINNYEYKVKIVEGTNEGLLMSDGRYHFGVTNFKDKEIYIAEDLPSKTMENTMIHEVVHAYIDSYGLLQVEWNDEIVADFIATYMENIAETLEEIGTGFKEEKKGRKE